MRLPLMAKIVFLLILIGAAVSVVYQIPAVNDRLSWRIDVAGTYLRTLIKPIQSMPAPLPAPEVVKKGQAAPVPTLSASPTPAPTALHTPTAIISPTPIPNIVMLVPPAWEKQDMNNCGPAALTMYLRYYGWEGNQKNVAQVIKPFRDDRNVNVEELAYFVRTNAGWLQVQYRVGGDLELLKNLIAAGFPVMIEESFYFDEPYWTGDDLWAAHYQLITGYDENAQVFIGQDSFHGADQQVPYKTLDEYWQAFNRVYIIIYPSEKEAVVQQILGADWDADINREQALKTAEEETTKTPENAYAWFNLGANLTYFENYIEATDAFDQARKIGLPQRMLRYQFSPLIAYFHSGQIDDLLTLTEYALDVTPNSEEALLWHGWGLYRQGKNQEALEDFQQALVENPNYQDAQYALDFIQGNP